MAFRVGFALGSNLGNRLSHLRRARDMIRDLSPEGSHFLQAPIYQSEPLDCPPSSPDFYNTALELDYAGNPYDLLSFTQGIEYHLGRAATPLPNAPRVVDIDILYFGNEIVRGDILTLPHPALTHRRFVLQPLSDICPEFILPGDDTTIEEHLEKLDSPETRTRPRPDPLVKPPPPMPTPAEKTQALRERKKTGPRITALTAYDYPTARLLDEAGVDLLLVGDSLGMVVLGYPDTTRVTLDQMLHHVAAAARGNKNALLVGDLPIGTYDTPKEALRTARKLAQAGAEAVKLEGGLRQAGKIALIASRGIPVVGHLGMLPQRVREEGGYRKKGKTAGETRRLLDSARALQEAGCCALVLESVLPKVAEAITGGIRIPTIGIGCGEGACDGEIAVVTDVLGTYPWFVPPFARPEANLAQSTTEAVTRYCQRVRAEKK